MAHLLQCGRTLGVKMNSVQKSKSSTLIKQIPWLYLFAIGIVSMILSTSAFADTYNFFFKKSKKNSSEYRKQEPLENVETDEEPESNQEENPQDESQKTGRDPIVINNYNNVRGAPSTEISPSPSSSSSDEYEEDIESQTRISPYRFGVSAMYFPQKGLGPDFFSSDNLNPLSAQAYGALCSFGYVYYPVFALNLYAGALQVPWFSKSLTHVGLEAEFYPFGTSREGGISTLELALLVGGSATTLSVDSRLVAIQLGVHTGARFSINFSPSFGISTVARIARDSVMIESGFVTRL
jgi:hypothetical protein